MCCPGTPYAGSLDEDAPSPRPKTLLEWMLGSSWRHDANESGREDRVDPDRPHFPEASTTVGKGRVVLESGYTFTEKGSSFSSHAYPEALLRIGMFVDWFEFRIGQSFLNRERTEAGARKRDNGAQDLYLGVKLALTEQHQYLPQIAVIPQMTVPTGSNGVTADRVLPGVNVDFGWEVIKDLLNIELLIATNRVADNARQSHIEVASGPDGWHCRDSQTRSFHRVGRLLSDRDHRDRPATLRRGRVCLFHHEKCRRRYPDRRWLEQAGERCLGRDRLRRPLLNQPRAQARLSARQPGHRAGPSACSRRTRPGCPRRPPRRTR